MAQQKDINFLEEIGMKIWLEKETDVKYVDISPSVAKALKAVVNNGCVAFECGENQLGLKQLHNVAECVGWNFALSNREKMALIVA